MVCLRVMNHVKLNRVWVWRVAVWKLVVGCTGEKPGWGWEEEEPAL